ncbi:MAG: polyphosphate kinase 1, partial [Panacagrimonas sp.]
ALLQSPFTLDKGVHDRIERETESARKGKPARIVAKMNSLVEPEIISKLYAASQAGVKIDLIVRAMCSLRPGVPGLSENIRVRSVVGRFLEHHRVFCFHHDGSPEVWLSSADWMERNLFRRVEIAFPLKDRKIRARVVEHLEAYVADTAQSWLLQSDGSYVRAESPTGGPGAKPVQLRLMDD